MGNDQNFGQSQAGHMGTGPQGTTGTGHGGSGAVGTPTPAGFNAASQSGNEPGTRSPEYRDNLTVQDESKPAGTSGIEQPNSDWNDTATGARTSGGGTDDSWARESARTGTDTTAAGVMGSSSASDADRDWRDNTDGAGRDRTDAVTTDETGTLISADKVQGTAVYDADGERLGTIDSLMLNKRSGKVAYSVMSFGGFLGIGERYHPLPWDSLTYDTEKGGYNVGHTTDTLRGGPSYSRAELDEVEGGRRSSEIDDYYGTALGGGMTRAGGVPIV